MDTNIENYSMKELTEILKLTYPAKSSEIVKKTNEYIAKYTKKGNAEMTPFFENVQSTLIENNEDMEAIKDGTSDNVYNVPVQKDVLNPLLTNITTRIVNIDSQFRDYTFEDSLFQNSDANYSNGEFSSSYFNANLCEPLVNVLSIVMENIIIPKSWYVIDSVYNNNFFWITNNNIDYLITIEPGNYTAEQFIDQMDTRLKEAGFYSSNSFCSINKKTGRFTFSFKNARDPSGKNLIFIPNEIDSFGETDENTLSGMLKTYAYFTFFDFGNIKYYKYI